MPEGSERVAAIVLAAGEARRMGGRKMLLPFGESTVVGSVVSSLEGAGIETVVVVAGALADEIRDALRGTRARVVENPAPERGMVSSVRVGVGALPAGRSRFVLALGDQPRLRAEQVTHLLEAQRLSGRGIAIATYEGKRGHPVVFDVRYANAILALSDEQTLRDVIHADPGEVVDVECGTDSVIRDIDTQDDYETELRRANEQ